MGFLTDEELEKFDMGVEMVSVYIPQAYHWAGQLYVMPRSRIRKLDKISPGDAMKYAVSGGVVDAEEEEVKIQPEKRESPIMPEDRKPAPLNNPGTESLL